uniref:Endogenous retrovirus group K member 7 Env polyprotein-like n=1 Tax=Monodelphis domestica TaxID=13616 RepID=K7E1I1_MONDO
MILLSQAPDKRNHGCFIGGFATPGWRIPKKYNNHRLGYNYAKIPIAMKGVVVMAYRVLEIPLNIFSTSKYSTSIGHHYMTGFYNIIACLSEDFAFMIGPQNSISIKQIGQAWNITCLHCNITECITQTPEGYTVLVVRRPPLALLRAKHSGGWYHSPADRAMEKLSQLIRPRKRRCISCLVLGIVALIAAITATTVSSVSLAQSVANVRTLEHDAEYLHGLAQNVTQVLHLQQDINTRVFYALQQISKDVLLLTNQLEILAIKGKLRCDYRYSAFCLLPVKANTSDAFEEIRNDLQGLWLKSNISEDIQQLNHIFDEMDSSLAEDFRPEHIADSLYNWIKSGQSWVSPLAQMSITILTFILFIVILVILLPCLFQLLLSSLGKIDWTLALHRVLLQNKKGEL